MHKKDTCMSVLLSLNRKLKYWAICIKVKNQQPSEDTEEAPHRVRFRNTEIKTSPCCPRKFGPCEKSDKRENPYCTVQKSRIKAAQVTQNPQSRRRGKRKCLQRASRVPQKEGHSQQTEWRRGHTQENEDSLRRLQ